MRGVKTSKNCLEMLKIPFCHCCHTQPPHYHHYGPYNSPCTSLSKVNDIRSVNSQFTLREQLERVVSPHNLHTLGVSTPDTLQCASEAGFWTSSKGSVFITRNVHWCALARLHYSISTQSGWSPWRAVFPRCAYREGKNNSAKDSWKIGSTGSTPTRACLI